MNTEKRLYRSQHALVGGVCAGMAEYFNIDPIVTRILFVVVTLSTAGLFVLVYVALWVILPEAPVGSNPLEVEPHSVQSDTYGQVKYESWTSSPPTMPVQPTPTTTAWAPPPPPTGPLPPTPQDWPPQPPVAAPSPQGTPPAKRSGGVKAALVFASVLLFFGIAVLLDQYVRDLSWWQLWPLVFMIMGIVTMVVPGEPGHRMGHFVDGLVLFCVGGVLLYMSLDVVQWVSLLYMALNLWPLLLIVLALSLIGKTLCSPWWTLAAGLCFAAFCVCGMAWYSLPGSTEALVLALPFGREFTLYLVPGIFGVA